MKSKLQWDEKWEKCGEMGGKMGTSLIFLIFEDKNKV